MEEKTKQRLIGVLVLIGVLFVILPFLFHNSRPSVADQIRAEEAATTTNTASQPTVTLPPENATLPTAATSTSTNVSTNTVSTNAPAAPATNTNAALPTAPAPVAQPIAPIPKTTSTPAPTTTPTTPPVAPTTPVVTPITDSTPAQTTPIPAKTSSAGDSGFQPDHSVSPVSGLTTGEASTSQAADATSSVASPIGTTIPISKIVHHHSIKAHHSTAAHWNVQLAVFSEKHNAEKLVAQLRVHHFPAHTKRIIHNHHPMIAVFVGPEKNETRAIAIQQRLRHEFHLAGLVRKIEV